MQSRSTLGRAISAQSDYSEKGTSLLAGPLSPLSDQFRRYRGCRSGDRLKPTRRCPMLVTKVGALLTAAVLIAGPPTVMYKKTRVFVLVPPEQILPGVKNIAVLDFPGQGADGRAFADLLTSKLFEKQRGIQLIRTTSLFGARSHTQEGTTLQQGAFTDVFVLIERSRLAQVLQEQRLAQSGLLDEAQAAQVGKILGVDAIVVGTVSFTVTDQPSREERTYTENRRQD